MRVGGKEPSIRLHDACTGTGCVAIAVKHRYPGVAVSCSDRSREALDACRRNSRSLLGSPLPAHSSDLLSRVKGRYHIITCNPPYLSDEAVDQMKAGGWPEPELALRGGGDGTQSAVEMARQALAMLETGGALMMEGDPHQMDPLNASMKRLGYRDIRILDDMSGNPRIITGRRG
jgi:release factor glutamine methyltransferase